MLIFVSRVFNIFYCLFNSAVIFSLSHHSAMLFITQIEANRTKKKHTAFFDKNYCKCLKITFPFFFHYIDRINQLAICLRSNEITPYDRRHHKANNNDSQRREDTHQNTEQEKKRISDL